MAWNDAKLCLTVVEFVYHKSMMVGCLLDLAIMYWLKKTTLEILGKCLMLLSVEFCSQCAIAPDAPFHFLHRSRSVTFHLRGRSPK